GINRLLTELYPDNAHFIYELLQNAEDPQATEVTFKLTESAVEFTHNGKRLFEFKDVESITSIGNSTKRDDATSIGKFGVGFKAVFAYTNTPEIHSGDFHFQIHDLVVPETKGVEQSTVNETRFVFPFDNPKKLSVLAASEVEKGLCALGDNTLLFLSHIRKINYSLPDGSQGSLERIDHENRRIEIRAKHPHSEETVSHWLHFHKDVDVTDADENIKNCRVAMAYQLEKVADKNKDSEAWKIIPVHGGGQVSIYFPAEKETSKLRFHIHAPFASTVARDSVRDCADNQQLRDHLAELIVESFTAIRDQKMLVMSFLAVLPTPKDELAEFYEPIREKIVDAFKTQLLTPTKSGSHAAAGALYRGSSKISDLVSDADLKVLTLKFTKYADNIQATMDDYARNAANNASWVANAPQRNSREDNFIESLDIKKWDFEQLSEIFATANKEKTESWLETKDDNWLRRFYGLLKDAKQHHEGNDYLPWAGKNFPLVRVNSEDGMKHVIGNQAYFESLHGHISTNGIHIVKREVYTKDNAKRDIDENAETFLESIGVRPFDTTAAIGQLLNRYKTPRPDFNSYDHYDDIKQFVRYWKEYATPYSWNQPTGFAEIKERFKTESFLLCTLDNKSVWQKASDICLDGLVFKTGLAEFTEIHQKLPIWHNYSKKLNEDELKDFIEFLKAMSVMHKLEIVRLDSDAANKNPNNPNKNKGYNGYGYDFSIPKLSNYIECRRTTASKLIWQALINAPLNVTDACFKPNRKPENKFDSLLIYELKDKNWIPSNKDNLLRTPRAMTRDDLPDDFPFNNNNGLLTALEFGKNAKDNDEKEKKLQEQANSSFKEKEKIAKDSGFESSEEMTAAAQLIKDAKAQGKSLEDMRNATLTQQTIPNFEGDYSSNPERRAGKVQEAAEDAPEKRTEMRQRSVAVDNTETKKAAKSYLKDKYTDDDKILYCQICNKEMPFKLSDGSYYFETVQLISDTQKRYKENYIALCPTDAAKFQYANLSKSAIGGLVDKLTSNRSVDEINASDEDDNCFEIELAGEIETLQFRRIHLMDLKAVLS
ncbi:MAG: hypothetical protein WCI06_04620, partial [Methylococcaceae bacterium]